MSLRPEEISAIIRQEIEGYENAVSMDEVGTILEVGDGIAPHLWAGTCHGR